MNILAEPLTQELDQSINRLILPRLTYLAIIRTALSIHEFRFARQAALSWLSAYPGDIEASKLYAQALVGLEQYQEAIAVFEGLSLADPEDSEILQDLIETRQLYRLGLKNNGKNTHPLPDALPTAYQPISPFSSDVILSEWMMALKWSEAEEKSDNWQKSAPGKWGEAIGKLRRNLVQGEVGQNQPEILTMLAADPPTPISAVTHLEILASSEEVPLLTIKNLALHYHQRWPACLACSLLLADALMESGEHETALELLHQTASRDLGGQIASRLWGPNHRYRALWPNHLELGLDISVPGSVIAALGWNLLQEGEEKNVDLPVPEKIDEPLHPKVVPDDFDILWQEPEKSPPLTSHEQPEPAPDQSNPEVVDKGWQSRFATVQAALDGLADRIKRPELKGLDNRLPVYVILSLKGPLLARYGEAGLASIENEISRLDKAIQTRQPAERRVSWTAQAYFADDPGYAKRFGLQSIHPKDPWALKLILADLDVALAKHGQRIGALLILGGPEIVPFHNLPNPVDDLDDEVASDNPYGTIDENYFIPQWPVGRITSGNSDKPDLLLTQLRQISDRLTTDIQQPTGWRRWLSEIGSWFGLNGAQKNDSFGYSAQVWQSASQAVYTSIGDPKSIVTSPPYGLNGAEAPKRHGLLRRKTKGNVIPEPRGTLAYFNLHGLIDAGEWYGQRECSRPGSDPDYPVALRPEDIYKLSQHCGERQNDQHCLPEIVFSEACYGAHIINKGVDVSLALRFLEAGTGAVVGSTCMSYGSIESPLIAADMLGYSFWKLMKSGLPVGEALRRAKCELVEEMENRQGYLDGEDQKTLISFVLYGDPLYQPFKPGNGRKVITRSLLPATDPPMVCDRICHKTSGQPLSMDMLNTVRQIVEKYLPGMSDAELNYAVEKAQCEANGHNCPTHQLAGKSRNSPNANRRVFVLNKSMIKGNHRHTRIARLTLDAQGKLVKLVVSR